MFEIFIQNAALLIALSFLNGTIRFYRPKKDFYYQIISGTWFGLVAIAAMMMAYEYQPGTIYDGRSVVLTLAGLWGGGIPTLISIIITGAYRIYLGGAGVYVGVATIISCSITGLIFRYFLGENLLRIKFGILLGIGVVTHLVMLTCQLFLPAEPVQVVKKIWVPVLLIFPVVFATIARLFQLIDRYISSDQRIRATEELYRTTLMSIGDAVICTDQTGKITQMNAIAENLTGWKFSEAKNENLDKIFHIISENTREKVENPFDKVITKGTIVGLANHTLLVSKNGKEIPVADSGAPIKNKNNEIIGVVLVFRDQSEERAQQQTLEKSEERFRNAVLMAPIPIMVHDDSGKILNLSEGWSHFSGYSIEEVPTMKDWTQKAFGDKAEAIEERVNSLFGEDKTIFSGESEITAKSGTKRIWNFHHTPLGTSGGKKIMLDIAPDVTQRIRTKQELEENEIAYRLLFENHIAVKLLIDPKDGSIIKANNAAAQFYGWSVEELENMTIFEISCLPTEEVKKYLTATFENTRINTDFKHRLASGEIRDIEIFSNRIDYKGKLVLHSIIHDVTDKKQAFKDLLDAKEKAEESERLKSAFLANVSHEIRTPLNGIVGFSNILAEDHNLSLEDKKEFAHLINKSSEGLLKIINDILYISRLETGKTQIENKPFDVCLMFDNLYSIFQKRVIDSDIQGFQLRLEKPCPSLIINGDEQRLIQIFSNLIDNAIRFTHQGNITFGVSSISNKEVTLFVSDTGIGIEKEKQLLIFERFMQADSGTARNYGGTGLGLAIVKKLLEMMGSEIHLLSEPGKGTRFWFKLGYLSVVNEKEVEQEETEAKKNTDTKENKDNSTKILVVEDNSASIYYLRLILGKNYSKLTFASTGKEALERYKTDSPDIILIDIGLPDMSGLDVIRKIREVDNNVRIIVQTAYAMAEDEQKAREAGCDDFLSKPMKTQVLLDKLQIK